MTTPIERFFRLTRPPAGCMLWAGSTDEKGYGYFSVAGKNVRAHRFAYELAYGSIPDGLTIDHLCRTTSCVNPVHLEAVTVQENLYRSPHIIRLMTKEFCRNGHEYSPENTYLKPSGGRECKACRKATYMRLKAKRQNENPPPPPRAECKRGHPYTNENRYVSPAGHTQCRVCNRMRAKQYRKAKQ